MYTVRGVGRKPLYSFEKNKNFEDLEDVIMRVKSMKTIKYRSLSVAPYYYVNPSIQLSLKLSQ